MAFLVRAVTNPKWVAAEWLGQKEVPADALSDLRTTHNRLSVWRLEADQGNLTAILEALASNRDHLDKLDYTLIDETTVADIPALIEVVDGDTPHLTSNGAHRDIAQLSAFKLALLADAMMPLPRVRISERQVTHLLLAALREGRLDQARLKRSLLDELTPKTQAP